MNPQGGTAATQAPTSGQMERSEQFLSPRVVAREAVKILAAKNIEVRPAMLRRLVKTYIDEGHTTLAQLERRVISYVDPTGEAAVRNVMRRAKVGESGVAG